MLDMSTEPISDKRQWLETLATSWVDALHRPSFAVREQPATVRNLSPERLSAVVTDVCFGSPDGHPPCWGPKPAGVAAWCPVEPARKLDSWLSL